VIPQVDGDVVRRAQRGDEEAFSVIVRTYQKPIFSYVLRAVADRELAEDLTQEVFLRAWRSLPNYAFRSQLSTWLYQVAKNLIFDERRNRSTRPPVCELVPESGPAALDPPIELTETIEELWAAIEELRPELKLPLLLRDVAGLSYKEIAETLDTSLANVKWRIYKARERVQLALAPKGVTEALGGAGA
jgi:RNA polymerase sigma-70 factor (ECF subfamily)